MENDGKSRGHHGTKRKKGDVFPQQILFFPSPISEVFLAASPHNRACLKICLNIVMFIGKMMINPIDFFVLPMLPHSTRKFLLDSWQRIAKQQRADKKEAETKRQHQDGHGTTRSELLTTENMWDEPKPIKMPWGEERSSQLLSVPLWSFHMAMENHHVFSR